MSQTNDWGFLGRMLGLGTATGADPAGLYTAVQSEALPTIPGTVAQPNLVREPTTAQPNSNTAAAPWDMSAFGKTMQGASAGMSQMQRSQPTAAPAAAPTPGFHRPQGGAQLPTQQGYQVQLSLPQLIAARGGYR